LRYYDTKRPKPHIATLPVKLGATVDTAAAIAVAVAVLGVLLFRELQVEVAAVAVVTVLQLLVSLSGRFLGLRRLSMLMVLEAGSNIGSPSATFCKPLATALLVIVLTTSLRNAATVR
jgi:hypothetical protein